MRSIFETAAKIRPCIRVRCILVSGGIFLYANSSLAQITPTPAGRYHIGHHLFEWIDSSRIEILADGKSRRRLRVDVWYPAKQEKAPTVMYLDTQMLVREVGEDGVKSFLGKKGASTILSGVAMTHAVENSAFHPAIKTAPVVFFSHGMGMITQLYTTQIEELASHGYIVAAITHPYDAWLVNFTDGKVIRFETTKRETAGGGTDQHIAYENERVEWWAADLRFALNQLHAINAIPAIKRTARNNKRSDAIPIAGHMDFSRVGAMGHSTGGRAAARACQLDPRFRSCANQDGVVNMQPFYREPNGLGITQRYLLFERDLNAKLSEADATSMDMRLDELLLVVDSLRRMKTAALAATGGSFHLLLNFRSSTHMSFSDVPLLQADDDTQFADALRVLRVTCRYTREFFDKTLRGARAPLFELEEILPYIDLIQVFPGSAGVK
jgi:dienelactone hydrolase